MAKAKQPAKPIRIPCPTIYPSRTTYGGGRPPEGVTELNVPCEGSLRPCWVCHKVRYCGREGHCLDSQTPAHVIRALFEIDGCDYGYPGGVPGWTRGEHWNGWECPRFEKAEAMALLKSQDEFGGRSEYDESTDTMRIWLDPSWNEPEPDEYKGTDIETMEGTKHVYAIGAWAWCWDTVDPRCDFCHGDHLIDDCLNIDPEQLAIELARREAEAAANIHSGEKGKGD